MRILQRVPTGKERIVQMILNFIAYADPELDIPKLKEALSVPEKVAKGDALDPQSIIRESSITRLCRSLVRKSNDGDYYEFAHFSVQEFLEGKLKTMPELEKFQVSESICQLLLAKQCLNYLLFRDFLSLPTEKVQLQAHIEMRNKQHPFYKYAAICWPVYARAHWGDDGLVELAERLFQPKKTENFITWALELMSFVAYSPHLIHFPTSSWTGLDQFYLRKLFMLLPDVVDKTFTTLHMAAALSLTTICSGLIGKGLNVDQQSEFGCPLQCAIQGLYLAPIKEKDYDGYDNDYMVIRLYYSCNYWRGRTAFSGFGRGDTIGLLFRSGATHLHSCSVYLAGQTLVSVALKVALWIDDVSAIVICLEAGFELEEDDLSEFSCFSNSVVDLEERKSGGEDTYGLEGLVLCLGRMIDRSDFHFRLCQAAWSLAIEMGCIFAQDPSIVDTRISLSQDAIAQKILKSVQHGDTETLRETLKDPRVDLTGDEDRTIFDEWLRHFNTDSKGLDVLKILLSAGMEVNRPNGDGLLPIHRLARKISINAEEGDCYEVLRDTVVELIRKGTGCTERSRANQNILHLGLRSIKFIMAVLEAETDENILAALRTQDDSGDTPIILALQLGWDDCALLLLERSNCDPEALRGPASVHALCVAGGTHRSFNFLLDAGVTPDTCTTDVRDKFLLHHLGPETSKEFALQLIHISPHGIQFRIDGKLPLDVYLENCIKSRDYVLHTDVLESLARPGSEELDNRDKKLVWEGLTQSIRASEAAYDLTWTRTRENNISKAVASLLQLGFFQSYEAVTHKPGILPLLEPLRSDLDDLRPFPTETICEMLEQTIFWESLRGSVEILRLLKAAATSRDVKLVELLLRHGVSVHQRVDDMCALEVACDEAKDTFISKRIFTLLLEYADTSCLDEINPHRSQQKGLIHYLAGCGKEGQLEELLNRGVDVNLRTGFHRDLEPAIVHHLLQRSSDSALALLERRADVAMADAYGMDAALAAVFKGDLTFLLRLHAKRGQFCQLNWEKTCGIAVTKTRGGDLVVTGANALHLAAEQGNCDILRFYLDKGLLTDINAMSVKLLYTPIHLAAFAGQIGAVKFIYSRGGSLGLKSADGSLPLHLAVRNEHIEVVRFLVENGSAMDADTRGVSPVGYAMQLQNQTILDCLRTTKHHLDYQSEQGNSQKDFVYAFEQALIRGDVKECELLRSQGCPVHVDLPGQDNRSALMIAIEDSNEELINWLLANGAKVTEQTFQDGSLTSPLQAMIMRPPLNALIPSLLQRYRNEGVSPVTEEPSLICIAIQHGNTIGLRLLLDQFAHEETTEL